MTTRVDSGTSDSPPDRDLVARAASGDPAAFETLVTRHYAAVYCVALANLGNHELAEDCSQEVFLRAYLNLCRVGEPDRIGGWLCRIARNLAQDWHRSRTGKAASNAPLLENLPDSRKPSQRDMLDRNTKWNRIQGALDKLPAAQRELLLLHYMDDLNDRQIGALLNVHRTTVRYYLRRALAHCRKLVDATTLREALVNSGPSDAVRSLGAAAAAMGAHANSTAGAATTPGESTWIAPRVASYWNGKALLKVGVIISAKKLAGTAVALAMAGVIGLSATGIAHTGPFRPDKVEYSAPTGPSGSSEIEGLRGITGTCRVRNGFDPRSVIQMLHYDGKLRFLGWQTLPTIGRHDVLIQSHALCGAEGIRRVFKADLESRYSCTFAKEQITTDVFVLRTTGGKPAPGLHRLKSQWGGPTSVGGRRGGMITVGRDTLDGIAHTLEGELGTPVIDETGLKGDYAGMIRWKAGDRDAFIKAVKQYLGLELVPSQRKLDYLVIRKIGAVSDGTSSSSNLTAEPTL